MIKQKALLGIPLGVKARYQTRVMDAKTGKCVKQSPWQHNLIVDQGLNAMAGQSITSLGGTQFPSNFTALRIGSGTNPVQIASGAITFTQSGTTLTASGGFFTAAMAGGLFKWGTGSGGTENYIASFTDSTHVELTNSDTVGTPDVGTVWQVQTTALQTLLFTTNTYQSNTGDNQVTFDSVDTITFQRTFINPIQASPYNVNELGFSNTTSGTNVGGKIVLSSTDVVGTSNFYVVVLQLQVTIAPATPTAVGDVGTNVNTAGNSMIEGDAGDSNTFMGLFTTILSTGANGSTTNGLFDRGVSSLRYGAITATYSQKSAPSTIALIPTKVLINSGVGAWTKVSGVLGAMEKTSSTSVSTSGQNWFGITIFENVNGHSLWDLKFTTPTTLPTGTFQPITNIRATFGRILTN